jgi:hypothetical protein
MEKTEANSKADTFHLGVAVPTLLEDSACSSAIVYGMILWFLEKPMWSLIQGHRFPLTHPPGSQPRPGTQCLGSREAKQSLCVQVAICMAFHKCEQG